MKPGIGQDQGLKALVTHIIANDWRLQCWLSQSHPQKVPAKCPKDLDVSKKIGLPENGW